MNRSRALVLGIASVAALALAANSLRESPGTATVHAQWRWPPQLFLPMAGRSADLRGLPEAPTAPPSPTSTATPEATSTPTPIPCGALDERVSVGEIDVAPYTIAAREDPRTRTTPMPVMLAVAPGGAGYAAAWSDTDDSVHITPLDGEYSRAGPDLTVPGASVRGFVIHPDGYALLVVRGDEMHLVRVNEQGGVVWDKRLVGGVSQTVAGNKWVDDWGHQGRLVFADGQYAAYFGHTQYFGANGKHQGDLLWLFDEDGERIEQSGRDAVGWDWGCSHSLDIRLAHNGTRVGPVCLSDAYPTKGIHFNHQTELRPEPSGDMRGYSAANLGGWVPRRDGFMLSFSSPEGRASSDVGMVDVTNGDEVGEELWLTNTAGVEESAPHLASYGYEPFTGNRYLAGWLADDTLTLAEVDVEVGVTEGPVETNVRIGAHDDFVALPDGGVGWAFAWDDFSKLKVVTVRWCER